MNHDHYLNCKENKYFDAESLLKFGDQMLRFVALKYDEI
jgi:hypothetical protein